MSDFQRLPNVLLQQRLARHSVTDPETGCILWMASRTRSGYGLVRWQRRLWLTHRAAWMARHGPIPKGLCICHRCDVRPCINPDHLFPGTQRDNIVDMYAKMGHERRPSDGGPERRPSKAPEIMRVQVLGREFVARILEVRPLDPESTKSRQ
jgi:hypothetical protein